MKSIQNHLTDVTNVLVIGCGGAGLRAAIEVKAQNLSVKVLGKRSKYDAHTVLAAGGINASFGNLDSEDSWLHHFADTYLEGYGIGDPKLIEIMAKNSLEAVSEIDKWGANLEKLNNGKFNQRFFGAHSFRRTCFSGDYTGYSILQALLKKAKSLKIPIFDSEYVSSLLIKENSCFGAMSINTISGERTIHLADSIILCTGGHTKIWKRSSSRKQENTGDGLYLSLKAGCQLIDMEMVQFHPTGMLFPEEMAGTLVTEAVRGEGGKLTNSAGKRFMQDYDPERMELSTRDQVAIANYTEIIEGRGTKNGGVFLDISHKSKDFIISKIPKIYRQFIESQMLDISKEAMEVAPTAHYSMGGIRVNSVDHSTKIRGLFAAGEVAGGLHGANRLGGNSLAEILVFGKIAGKYAAEYSKNLKIVERSNDSIKEAHEEIDCLIKKGSELVVCLQADLSETMWKHCGVIKDEENLNEGLRKVNDLENLSCSLEVNIGDNNMVDLINTLNFKASLITAKTTIKSAIHRKETLGAHNRSDYPLKKNYSTYNLLSNFYDGEIKITKINTSELKQEMEVFIKDRIKASESSHKLLE